MKSDWIVDVVVGLLVSWPQASVSSSTLSFDDAGHSCRRQKRQGRYSERIASYRRREEERKRERKRVLRWFGSRDNKVNGE